MNQFILVIATIVLAPIAGGLLFGIDRRITARLQGRFGPPILQPFYDIFKLLGKESIAVSNMQFVWIYAYLILMIASLLCLVLQSDFLVLVFLLGFAGVSLVLGGFSTKSPYSHFGANRELLQILAYEPVLLLLAIAIYAQNGTFLISEIISRQQPLLQSLWPLFIAVLYVLTIKMRKSPFDISTSHHAHQEIVKGITTEYSGPFLAIYELAEWYEIVLVLGIIVLFWANPLWVGLLIALAAFLLELVVDNIAARMTARWMVRLSWSVGLTLGILNIAYLYIMKGVF
ncbi:MAG TPA: NADH-quinone oxidoreductase subunit H [Deltaproteobacteria bacterium]|nr:NADH-quinone oxidoreductase subunit H [Deltaproteobacteria bacterium]